MGMMLAAVASGASVSNPGASAETVIYTTPVLAVGSAVAGANPIVIRGFANILTGTGTTTLTIRVRQGSLTGPLVSGAPAESAAAGSVRSFNIGAVDLTDYLASAGGGVYVITAQQTGGTGAGTTNLVFIEVEI